ncbi:unnamed protein product [Caenorhabditis auriculariae]|uniref:phospholipase D n=1 Tax=Caenorhabditis auriculariae TaxID=2777116 RepID=A0A8S1HMR6_9PELO|nr:unnamed protein product [Caenorhabditis auriculariae]
MHRFVLCLASAIVVAAFWGQVQAGPLPVASTELATTSETTAIDTLGSSSSRVKRSGCGCCGCCCGGGGGGCCCCRPRCCCCCRRCCTCCRTCCCTRCCTCCRPCCCGCGCGCGCGCCGCGGGGRKRRSLQKLRIAHADKQQNNFSEEVPSETQEATFVTAEPVEILPRVGEQAEDSTYSSCPFQNEKMADDNVSFTDTAADGGGGAGAKPSNSAMMDLIGTLNKNAASADSKAAKKKKGDKSSSGGGKKGKKGKTKKVRKADRFESQNFLMRIEGSLFCAAIIVAVVGLLVTLVFFFTLLIMTKGDLFHMPPGSICGKDMSEKHDKTTSGKPEPDNNVKSISIGNPLNDSGVPGLVPPTRDSGREPIIRFRARDGRSPEPNQGPSVKIEEMQSPTSIDYGEYGDDSDDEDADEIQYCDCIAVALQQSLPGTPGKKGIIPYMSIYDTQAQARRRGYWIPGVPVNAKIVKVERNTDRGIHFINSLLYTIELEHGQFRWSVVRNYKDFTLLNNRLIAHRAGQHIKAPIKRTQERLDSYLENIGIDIIPDHKPECPYSHVSGKRKRNSRMHILKREADVFDRAPVATVDGSLDATPEGPEPKIESRNVQMQQAVQSGILNTGVDDNQQNGEGSAKRKRTRQKHVLPSFPMMPDSMVSNIEQRKEQLENWLQMVLHIPVNRNHHETAEFLEVSRFSFVNELGGKHTEGFVKKRPGGSRVFLGWTHCCVKYLVPWSKRWLMVRDSFVAYMDHRTEVIRMVLLMDKDFKVAAGGKEANGIPTGLIITNTQHELHLKCRRLQDTSTWKAIIERSMNGIGNVWLQPQRFSSSFPIRENSYAKWFVDAKDYMEYAADMMELAREEIYITDWWLSPEIFMKRPALEGNYWRLDEILKRKAEQGVKVFVLLYKEMEMALGLNSIYSKKTLQGLHENIKVMRHPDHYPSTGTFFWAHHEKLLIIDQLISFVGGVDLCFGRWDSHHHFLTDLGSVQFADSHAVTVSPDMASGLRALVSAPLTLSPLGLEENEEVSPRSEKARNDTRDETTTDFAVSRPSALKDIPENEDEVVFTDKETGGVMVRVIKKKPQTSDAQVRHSSPPGALREEDNVSQPRASPLDAAQKSPTAIKLVQDSKGKKEVRRAISSLDRKHVPRELLDKAGPASIMFEKAARSGMDLSEAAEKYKEYVNSGAVQMEKHRAQTPPSKRKKDSRISRVVGNWKHNRAKRKWRQIIDNDEATLGYELDWLRLREMDNKDDELNGGGKLWYGKDYVNYIHKDFVEVDMPFHDFIDRGTMPRMPWHDIHSVTFGAPARDLARHFIQRWNATKTEKLKDDSNYPFLLPKSYENVRVPRVFKSANVSHQVNVQVLRSLSNWSGLINQTEDSIQMAYLSLIANSKHYLYIENQFFVSMIDSNDVTNEVCKVIYNRIVRAYKEKENYRVYILIPLMPGFEGDVGAPGGSSLQAVLHWTFQSLSQGPNSLIERLKAVMPDPFKYIHVASLRTYDQLGKKLVSELIYIHCKLMIVDDEHVIIGSANINDRSQCGNRDSEVCCVYSDVVKEPSVMDGKPFEAGKFAKSLRLQCMKEHLGLLSDSRRKSVFEYDVSCDDPVADSFFVDVWQRTAKNNARIYEEVFRAYPTDQVETFEEYQKWTSQMPLSEYAPQQAEERVRELKGHLVHFPLNFLSKAVLTPGMTSKEGLVEKRGMSDSADKKISDEVTPPKPTFVPPRPPVLQPNIEHLLKQKPTSTSTLPPPPVNPFAPRQPSTSVVQAAVSPGNKSLPTAPQPEKKSPSPIPSAGNVQRDTSPAVGSPAVLASSELKQQPPILKDTREKSVQPEAPAPAPVAATKPESTAPKEVKNEEPKSETLAANDRVDMSGGLVSWFAKAVSDSKLLTDVAGKAKAGMETVLTTLDPGMKPYLAGTGTLEVTLVNADPELTGLARERFCRVLGLALMKNVSLSDECARTVVHSIEKAEETCLKRISRVFETNLASGSSPVVAFQPFVLQIGKPQHLATLVVLRNGEHIFTAVGQPLEISKEICEKLKGKREGGIVEVIRELELTEKASWAAELPPYSSPELFSFAFLSVAQKFSVSLKIGK